MENRIFLALIGLTVHLALGSVAAAQTSSDDRARLHFESGRSYFDEGAYERALQEFERAYELSPRTIMLFNLGTTYERLNRLREAANAFERFLAGTPDYESSETMTRRIANLRARADRLDAQSNPSDNDVSDDDEPDNVTLRPTEASEGDDGLLIGGIVSLSVAGAALVATGVLGGLAVVEKSNIEGGCFANGPCSEDEISGLRTLTMATDVSWIVGAAAGAAGAVLLVVSALSNGDSNDDQASIRFTGTGFEGSF